MSPSEFLGRADREPKIPSQNLDLRTPKACERERVGWRPGASDDPATVDDNSYVTFIAGKPRAEIKAGIRSDAGPKSKIARSVESRRPLICERRGCVHDQHNLGRYSREVRHVLSPPRMSP